MRLLGNPRRLVLRLTRDAATLHRLLGESGFLPEPERVDPEHLLAFVRDAIWWYTTADELVALTPEIATNVMIESSDPRSSHFREMRHQDMRPDRSHDNHRQHHQRIRASAGQHPVRHIEEVNRDRENQQIDHDREDADGHKVASCIGKAFAKDIAELVIA